MNRALASGPVVWLGIIVVTCLLLAIFQTVLWLVVPVLLSVIAYYMLSPLVSLGMARGMTRPRAVLIVTVLLTVFLIAVGLIIAPKIPVVTHDLPKTINDYGQVGIRLINNANQTLDTYFPFLHHQASPPKPARPEVKSLGFVGTEVVPATPPTPLVTPADDVENRVASLQTKYSGNVAVELLHWIPSLLLVPYITYFFLLDGPRFKRFLMQAIPNAFFEKTLYLFYRVEDQLRRYFRGLLGFSVSARRFSWPLWPPSWPGFPILVPSREASWWSWWRRMISPAITGCPTKSWGFSSACGCSTILFSCR